MARHGDGSFDKSTRTWKVRSAAFQCKASIRVLRSIFGDDVPDDETGSARYWRKFREQEKEKQIIQKYESLEGSLINRLSSTQISFLMNDQRPEQPKEKQAESLKTEIEAAIAKAKETPGKGWMEKQRHLRLFAQVCGNISVKDIGVQHFEKFRTLQIAKGVSETSNGNAQKAVKNFIRKMGMKYQIYVGYLDNDDYDFKSEDGQKVQWTMDQIQTALDNATGAARHALLCGLNFGWYLTDCGEFEASNINGEYVSKRRYKHRNKQKPMVPAHYMWAETKASLAFGFSERQLTKAFDELRKKFNLPEHSDLRKTVQQWIEDDEQSDYTSRLYRCEFKGDVHNRFYSRKYTPAQIEGLRMALVKVEIKLFGDGTI